MPIVWRSVRTLQLVGLTVISVVTDGVSNNHKFSFNFSTSEIWCYLEFLKFTLQRDMGC